MLIFLIIKAKPTVFQTTNPLFFVENPLHISVVIFDKSKGNPVNSAIYLEQSD